MQNIRLLIFICMPRWGNINITALLIFKMLYLNLISVCYKKYQWKNDTYHLLILEKNKKNNGKKQLLRLYVFMKKDWKESKKNWKKNSWNKWVLKQSVWCSMNWWGVLCSYWHMIFFLDTLYMCWNIYMIHNTILI